MYAKLLICWESLKKPLLVAWQKRTKRQELLLCVLKGIFIDDYNVDEPWVFLGITNNSLSNHRSSIVVSENWLELRYCTEFLRRVLIYCG